MARKIVTHSEAVESPVVEQSATGTGAVFIKNHLNEIVKFEDGTTYRFSSSREKINDPVLADKLRAVATKFGIFEKK